MPVNDGQQDPPPSDEAAFEPEHPIGEECGVFGVWAPGEDVAKLTYYGLYALQHRGQEAAGMAVSRRQHRARLQGARPGRAGLRRGDPVAACAATSRSATRRYSTTGSGTWENAQPSFRTAADRRQPRARPQRQPHQHRRARPRGSRRSTPRSRRDGRDHRLRPHHHAAGGASRTCRRTQAALRGAADCCRARSAWSSWTSTRCTPPATRTACARWCSAGSSAAGSWPARRRRSTSSARRFVREVEPGELLAIDEHGVRSSRASPSRRPRAACSSTSTSPAPTPRSPAGRCYTDPRRRSAARWPSRRRSTPTWSSRCRSRARPAAIGFAEQSGIPYGQGLVKNAYVGRTFIQPSPDDPPARHPAQAQPAARGHPRQAARRRRRLDRARQHPARAGADAARGRRRARCTSASPARR